MDITSRKNPLIQEFKSLLKDKKTRQEKGMFVVEGAKLIQEALKSNYQLGEYALVTKAALEKYGFAIAELKKHCEIITINEDLSAYIADTKTPQGVFAQVKALDKKLNLDKIEKSRRFIILENLQDMGNIGTVVRTCDAFSFDGILMSADCGDITSPKIIRSTMGSIFRVPVYIYEDISEGIDLLKQGGFTVYGAMLDRNAEKLGKADLSAKTAVVIGNEGNGITDYAAEQCDKKLYIPMNNAESLNAAVAAGIICWEMAKNQ